MTRQESLVMKGIAILLMLWLHLFNMQTPLYSPLFYIGDNPVERYLTCLTKPVGFFCFLSGYGMHVLYEKGKDKHRWSRIGKLYIHWWIILSIYIIVYQLITSTHIEIINHPTTHAFNYETIIKNITAFDTSWYHPGWFLFPYMCLSLFAFNLFELTARLKVWQILLFFWILGLMVGVFITRNSDFVYSHRLVANIASFISLMPAFMFGAMAHKTKIIVKMQCKTRRNALMWCVLIVFSIFVCWLHMSIWGGFYPAIFTILFLASPRWTWVDKMLAHLGKYSMDMWLIHAWLYYYLFKEEFYSLKYPIVIFGALVISSLVCSYFVTIISNFIYERAFNNNRNTCL